MADVFISYARTDAATAEAFRRALLAHDLTVFLDTEGLDGGDVFTDVLDRELRSAGCVLGLWTPAALTRPWVRLECQFAKDHDRLVPVAIAPLDAKRDVPIQFYGVQFEDLTGFTGDTAHPKWPRLLRGLSRSLGRPVLATTPAAAPIIRPVAEPALPRISADEEVALLLIASDPQGANRGAWQYPLHQQITYRGISAARATIALSGLRTKGLAEFLEVETTDPKGNPSSAPAVRITDLGLAVFAQQADPDKKDQYVYDITLKGDEARNQPLLDAILENWNVQRSSRFVALHLPGQSCIRVWSFEAIPRDAIRAIADAAAIEIVSIKDAN